LTTLKTKTGTLWEPMPVLSRHAHPFDVAVMGHFSSIETKVPAWGARRY